MSNLRYLLLALRYPLLNELSFLEPWLEEEAGHAAR